MADAEADRIHLAQLTGVASHLVCYALDTPDQRDIAVEELRQLAHGRADLLAELAGVSLGVGESQLDADRYRQTADLCVEAGADNEQIPAWVDVGRSRAAQAKISSSAGVLRRW